MITVSLGRYENHEKFHQALDWIYTGMEDPRNIPTKQDGALVIQMAPSLQRRLLQGSTRESAALKDSILRDLKFECLILCDNNSEFFNSTTIKTLEKWSEISTLPSIFVQERVTRKIFESQRNSIANQVLNLKSQHRSLEMQKKDLEYRLTQMPLALSVSKSMRQKTEYCDFEFLLADGKKIKAIFSILSQLPFFAPMPSMAGGRTKPISPSDPLQLDLSTMPVSEAEVNQFLDFRYGLGLPQGFDPVSLFPLADYLQDEALMKDIIFSQIRSDAANHSFLLDILSRTTLSFTDPEKIFLEMYIQYDWEKWSPAVNESVIKNWDEQPIRPSQSSGIEKENLFAQMFLVQSYFHGICTPKNPQKTSDLLHSLADAGHAWSQAKLGLCYGLGFGVEKSIDKAVEWVTLSANQGHPLGQCRLAMFSNGHRRRSREKRFISFKRSADQGDPLAQNAIGEFYEKAGNLDLAKEQYAKAASRVPEARESLQRLTNL